MGRTIADSRVLADLVGRLRIFGAMSLADWRRWAFLHTDHHLRQFGL